MGLAALTAVRDWREPPSELIQTFGRIEPDLPRKTHAIQVPSRGFLRPPSAHHLFDAIRMRGSSPRSPAAQPRSLYKHQAVESTTAHRCAVPSRSPSPTFA